MTLFPFSVKVPWRKNTEGNWALPYVPGTRPEIVLHGEVRDQFCGKFRWW
jgi:hypothetical protein